MARLGSRQPGPDGGAKNVNYTCHNVRYALKCDKRQYTGMDHAMLDPWVSANLLIIKEKREPFVDFVRYRAASGDLLSHTNCYRIFRRGGGSIITGKAFRYSGRKQCFRTVGWSSFLRWKPMYARNTKPTLNTDGAKLSSINGWITI